MGDTKALVPAELIEKKIYLIRGQKVILDSDLAELFSVETKRLNEQVKRNLSRFPEDFMFQLTKEETQIWHRLRSQFATLKRGQHLKYQPYAFTEYGAIMAANVLNSQRAIEMSVLIVRAFIRLREMLATHKQLAKNWPRLRENTIHNSGWFLKPLMPLCRSRSNPSAKSGLLPKNTARSMPRSGRESRGLLYFNAAVSVSVKGGLHARVRKGQIVGQVYTIDKLQTDLPPASRSGLKPAPKRQPGFRHAPE